MAAQVLTYSPSDVKLIISGYTLGGIMSISFRWTTPPFRMVRGIRGRNTRVYNQDRSAVIEIEVQQTSVTNDVLSSIVLLDYAQKAARLDLALSDNSGRTLIQTAEAYVTTLPDITYSSGFNVRRWTFEILEVTDGTITGAANQDSDFFSSFAGADLLNKAAGIGKDALNTVTGFL